MTYANVSIHNSEEVPQDGLTKRELFAAMAMQGLTSHVTMYDSVANEWIASEAVRRADALINALNEVKP